MKKYVKYLAATTLSAALLAGCTNADGDDQSPYERGLKALENENADKAEEQFEDASEENKDKADNYLKLINTAKDIDKSMEGEEYNSAINSYESIKSDENLSSVEFIYAEQREELKKIKKARADIDKKMYALNDFYSPDDKGMTANELYIAKTDEMLKSDYLTDEQKSDIKSFQEKVKDNMNNDDSTKESKEEAEDNDATDESNDQTEDKNNEKESDGKQEEDKPEDESTDDSNLSQDEAYDTIRDHLIDIGQISQENLQSDQYSLDFDHKANGKYVFQLYETVMNNEETGHKVTIGWYEVNEENGEVSEK